MYFGMNSHTEFSKIKNTEKKNHKSVHISFATYHMIYERTIFLDIEIEYKIYLLVFDV